jgi:hypothetical protein
MEKNDLTVQEYDLPRPHGLSMALYFLGFTASMVLAGKDPAIEIKRPWILLAVSLAALLPWKNKSFSVLGKLLAVYFVCMLISQLTINKLVLGGQGVRLLLPKTVIPLFFYAAAFIQSASTGSIHALFKRNRLWYGLWGIMMIVLTAHMMIGWVFLKTVYGFGYEQNISVFGNIVLYLMCFVFTWDLFDQGWVRRLSFGWMAGYLFIVIIV